MIRNLNIKVMPQVTRGCGVRKVGGLYIFCEGKQSECYRFPMALPEECPCCGEKLRQIRSIRIIDPHKLWGDCTDVTHPCHKYKCFVCFPPKKAGLMWVGKEYYTPEHFVIEAGCHGVSKRIPALPVNLGIGDRLYFVHNEAFPRVDENMRKIENRAGVFFASTITAFHKIINEKQADDAEYINGLVESGITPVLEIEDGSDEYTRTCEYNVPQKSILDYK
jgi:hypothetical protein